MAGQLKTYSELIQIAGELVENAQKNLNRSNSIASVNLSESIIASEPQKHGSVLTIDIMMNDYGKFVNNGVRDTRSGSGFYVFKYDNPSKKHVDAIREWIKRAGLSTSSVKKYSGYGQKEKRTRALPTMIMLMQWPGP